MRKKVLVTGSHRSGTTWTGKTIAKAKGMRYVHEPFNVHIKRKKPLKTPFKYDFEYLEKNEKNKVAFVYLNMFCNNNFLFNIKRFINVRSINEFKNLIVDIKSRKNNETVIKDPIAIMSAEWLYNNFDINVVILIRHPAAFIASLRVKGWEFDFKNIKNQEKLVENLIPEYKKAIENQITKKRDIIEQGILLWNIIHKVILKYSIEYEKKWYFIRHEDLSINPIKEFKDIFKFLNLKFDDEIHDYIKSTTEVKMKFNDIEKSIPIENVKRNSKQNIKTWKKRLDNEEIEKIKKETYSIWKEFYTEKDW